MKSAATLTRSRLRETPPKSLYHHDFYAWVGTQVDALRGRRFDELDLENLLEEVHDLAASLQRELRNRFRIVLVHLLKWQFQPSKHSTSWRVTLLEQRYQLAELLEQNPSLSRQVPDLLEKVYPSACKRAGLEMKLAKINAQSILPARCPWTPAQILDDDFLPSPSRPRG